MKIRIALFLLIALLLTACSPAQPKDTPTVQDGTTEVTDTAVTDTTADEQPEEQPAPEVKGEEILMPTKVYFSEEHTNDNCGTFEYDEQGNVTSYHIKNAFTDRTEKSKINRDENDRVTSVSTYQRDKYSFVYGEDGAMTTIYGEMGNSGDGYEFKYSEKEGSAYEMIVRKEKYYIVEQYDEDFRLTEQLHYNNGTTEAPFHRRYFTYDEKGRISVWNKTYDGRYDFTDTYTDADFDAAGHCITQYTINGANMKFTEEVRNWQSTTELDALGRVVKDTHTCPDVERFITTHYYNYGLDGKVESFSYAITDTQDHRYNCVEYTPVRVQCDPLQKALIMIYSQDTFGNSLGSFRSLTVDWAM